MGTAANTASSQKKCEFVGGDLCLDFTNTMGGKRGVAPRQYFNAYADFGSWCRQAGLLDSSKAQALARLAARRVQDSAAALRRAIALRETIYRIFGALASDEPPQASDLDQLNAHLSSSLGRLRVVPSRKGFTWSWAEQDESLDQPLGPIARSAADLLTFPHLLARVRQCAGDTRRWPIVASTKKPSRRVS